MKKMIALLLALMMLLLTACGSTPATDVPETEAPGVSTEAPTEAPEEEAVQAWQVDTENHWHLDSEANPIDVGAHDGDFCSVCGAEILDFGDGEIWVQMYNDYGDTTLSMILRGNEVVEDYRYDYTYDEEGYWETLKEYRFGMLVTDILYQTLVLDDGWVTSEKLTTTYFEEGGWMVKEYDDNGDAIKEWKYDADGNEIYAYTVFTEYDDNGYVTSVTKCAGDVVMEKTVYEYNEFGEYTAIRYYEGDRLTMEELYTSYEMDDFTYSYCCKTVSYGADGTETVTEFDEYGNVIG